MAASSYARDIYFGVRVEDRATRPLRRIVRDFQLLGKQGLQQRMAVAGQARGAELAARARVKSVSAQLQEVQNARTLTAQTMRQQNALARETQAKLKSAGVSQNLRRLDEQRITAANKLGQVEMALAQRRTKAGQIYESQLAKVSKGEIAPRALSRAGRGILMPRLTETQIAAEFEKAQLAMATLNRQEEILAERAGLATGALEKQRIATAQLSLADTELAAKEAMLRDQFAAASIAHSNSIKRMNEADVAVSRFPVDRLKGIATYLRHIGSALAVVGGVGVAVFAGMAKASADFSTQVTVAATQSTIAGRNSVMQVQKNAVFIQKEIQKLMASGQVISSPEEQTAAIYKIFSGVRLKGSQLSQLKQGIQLLKEFNKVTVANVGLVTLEEATQAGIILFNRFGVSVDQMPEKLNIFQAAVRFGDLTMSEFLGTLGTVAPAAQSAGYNITQMSAAVAFISKQFSGSLRLGTTGYARLLEIFARRDVIDGLKGHGVAITSVKNGVERLLPLQVIAQRIFDKYPESIKKGSVWLQNFFKEFGKTQGTIQARRLLSTYIQHLEGAKQTLKDVTRDHNELQKSLAAAQASPGVRWAEFTVQFKALAYEIGTGVLPAVAELANGVRGLASWFNNLSPEAKRAIGYFGAMTAVATLLLGTISFIVGGLGSLALAFGFVQRGIIGSTAAAGAASEGVAVLATEVGAATAEYAALLGIFLPLGIALVFFRDETFRVVKMLGGLHSVLIALSIYMATRAVRSLKLLAFEEAVATRQAMGLRLALLGLTEIGVILIPIYLVWKSDPIQDTIDDLKKGREGLNPYLRKLGGELQDAFTFKGDPRGRSKRVLQETFDFLTKEVKKKDNIKALTIDFSAVHQLESAAGRIKDHLEKIKKAARDVGVVATPSFRKLFDNYAAAAQKLDTLKKSKSASITDLYKAEMAKAEAAAALQSNVDKQKAAAAIKAGNDLLGNEKKFSDAIIIAEEKKVLKLKKLAENSDTFQAWKKYYRAVAKLSEDATPAQLQAVQQLYEQTAETVQKFSDAQILAQYKHVQALQKAAENAKTVAAWKKYYTALDKLNSDATSSQLQSIEQIYGAVDSTTTKMSEKYKEVFNTIKSQYDKFLSQNQSAFGTLFSGPYMQSAITQNRLDWGQVLNTKDLILDLGSQVQRFRQWRRDITKLRKLGLPQSLVDQIAALGPEAGMKQAELIARMTPKQLATYKRLWREGQKDIHDATMHDVQTQLNSWRKHGRQIALAIARGLRDENTALESSLKTMIERAFPGLVGGTGASTNKPAPNPSASTPLSTDDSFRYSRPSARQHAKAEATNNYYNDHYHITTTASPEDAKNQARQAHFAARTKHRHRN